MSTTAKIGAGIYVTYSGAVKIDLIIIYKQGDFNKNGKLDEEDAKMLLKHLSGGTQLDDEQYARADVNGDGYKDILDVIAILNIAKN
ncbi:MAG: dockerin type I repeat-containing protein [Firmicutes bacterium]|nr:dockerin type I repeat-containing protein [Bacillota bacterium]